jgi:hypothetical protein
MLPQANLEAIRGAKKQTAAELQTACQVHASRPEITNLSKPMINN